jgi:hypothetical protein
MAPSVVRLGRLETLAIRLPAPVPSEVQLEGRRSDGDSPSGGQQSPNDLFRACILTDFGMRGRQGATASNVIGGRRVTRSGGQIQGPLAIANRVLR